MRLARVFNGNEIKIAKVNGEICFSVFDISKALKINRREIINLVIENDNELVNKIEGFNDNTVYVKTPFITSLILKVKNKLALEFASWIIETTELVNSIKVTNENRSILKNDQLDNNRNNYFATTQVAKKFGLSAKSLNEILHKHRIQFKVNDQWVLYSEYQDENLTVSLPIKKKNNDEVIYHTYWTEKGANFISSVLKNAGLIEIPKQLSIYDYDI